MKRKTVPDSWSSNTEAWSAELCPGSRNEHVTAMDRTEYCPTGGVDHCGADVFEVVSTSATDAVECGIRNLELNPLGHRQPVDCGEHHAGLVKYGHACLQQQPGEQQRSAVIG